MNRIILKAVSILLVLGGLAAFVLAVIAFVRAVPEGVAVSMYDIGQWFPGYGIIGIIAASVGIILLTFHRFYP